MAGLRAALLGRRLVLSTFVMIPRVEVVELLASCGFTALVFDLEHGPMEIADLNVLVALTQGAGMYAVARLADNQPADIARALDSGVDGILAPHVGSAAAARDLVEAGRFPPDGSRSLNPFTRGTGYGVSEELGPQLANRRVALMAMLEGNDALRSLDEVCAVDGLDAVFVGPVDLSAAFGFPGQPEHPTVIDRLREIIDRIESSGCAAGIYAHTPEAAARWGDAGATFIALSADSAMAADGFRRHVEAARLAEPAQPLGEEATAVANEELER